MRLFSLGYAGFPRSSVSSDLLGGWEKAFLSDMQLFLFFGFLIGFVVSLRFVKKLRKALIWGITLGIVPLLLTLGPATTPVEGIGSALHFAFFALGPIKLLPFLLSGAALGMASASVVLWAGQNRPTWVGWTTGLAILMLTASVTLWPTAQREIAKQQLAVDREARAEEITRAHFEGTMAGHQIAFPASPRLHVFDDCAPGVQAGPFGCSTSLVYPVSILTKSNDVLLHERLDPIHFRTISVSAIVPDCRLGNYCLTQEKVDLWCRQIRPDKAGSIWCRDAPAMQFELRIDATPGPSDREEPELAVQFSDTVLGPSRATCFYSPNRNETDRQGASCRLTFNVASGVSATIGASREQVVSDDPALGETIELIREYWAALTESR